MAIIKRQLKIRLVINFAKRRIVIIKAAGGGGGKGMKIVHNEKDFDLSFSAARIEAMKYFGNDEVYIEKFFQNPRHIEVQILSLIHI